jgi:hypothetical protein
VSVSEFERHQLFTWFEEQMGRERAATMMNLVPPAGWGDVATRRDIHLVEARIDALEARLRSDMMRTFGTWLFASQAVLVAAVSVLVALN